MLNKIRDEFENELGKSITLSVFDIAVVLISGVFIGFIGVTYGQFIMNVVCRLLGL